MEIGGAKPKVSECGMWLLEVDPDSLLVITLDFPNWCSNRSEKNTDVSYGNFKGFVYNLGPTIHLHCVQLYGHLNRFNIIIESVLTCNVNMT